MGWKIEKQIVEVVISNEHIHKQFTLLNCSLYFCTRFLFGSDFRFSKCHKRGTHREVKSSLLLLPLIEAFEVVSESGSI